MNQKCMGEETLTAGDGRLGCDVLSPSSMQVLVSSEH